MPVLELHPLPVVVGVDGSRPSRAALRWAYRHAARSAAPLEVVTAWPTFSRDAGVIDTEEQARAIATQAVAEELPADHRPVNVRVSPFPGEAEDVLLRRARRATLIVVGPHGRHSMTERLLGSVTEHVVAEAECPVAIVHADAAEALTLHRVVVGVDGSPASLAALRWAARYAVATDAKVEALLVWDWLPEFGVYPYGPDERQQHARAEAALARSISTLPEQLRPIVHSETVRGHAADVLVTASQTADAVVVGNTRISHMESHLLGSVSRKVALHATVPVVVIHAPRSAPATAT